MITIKEEAKIAIKMHNIILLRSSDLLIVYTDGSSINRKVGAVAVAL
jgi:hypothetical protein